MTRGSLPPRLPRPAQRGGIWNDLVTPFFNPGNGSNCNVVPANRTQFANGVISKDLLSSQTQNLLKFIPFPNIPAATGANPNYSASGAGIVNWDGFDVRMDRYQTEKMHMFGRYSLLQVDQVIPGAFGFEAGGPNFAQTAFAGAAGLRDQSLSYGLDYIVSPTWLADFRFGFFRYRVLVNPNGLGTSPAKDAGIPGLNLDSYYTSAMPRLNLQGTRGFSFRY